MKRDIVYQLDKQCETGHVMQSDSQHTEKEVVFTYPCLDRHAAQLIYEGSFNHEITPRGSVPTDNL